MNKRTYWKYNIDDYEAFLLKIVDFADDRPSKLNLSFTKEQAWNIYIGAIVETRKKGKSDLHDMIKKNIAREFGPLFALD